MKKIETSLPKISALALERERENWEFRAFLKYEYTSSKLDRFVHRLFKEVSAEIDCTQCNNCCREIYPIINQSDIKAASKRLQLSSKEFIEQYLALDDDGFIFNQTPCPFLRDGHCSIYGAHPKDCKSYPHLHKNGSMSRLIAVIENYGVCPIVFNVYEALKRELWSRGRTYY